MRSFNKAFLAATAMAAAAVGQQAHAQGRYEQAPPLKSFRSICEAGQYDSTCTDPYYQPPEPRVTTLPSEVTPPAPAPTGPIPLSQIGVELAGKHILVLAGATDIPRPGVFPTGRGGFTAAHFTFSAAGLILQGYKTYICNTSDVAVSGAYTAATSCALTQAVPIGLTIPWDSSFNTSVMARWGARDHNGWYAESYRGVGQSVLGSSIIRADTNIATGYFFPAYQNAEMTGLADTASPATFFRTAADGVTRPVLRFAVYANLNRWDDRMNIQGVFEYEQGSFNFTPVQGVAGINDGSVVGFGANATGTPAVSNCLVPAGSQDDCPGALGVVTLTGDPITYWKTLSSRGVMRIPMVTNNYIPECPPGSHWSAGNSSAGDNAMGPGCYADVGGTEGGGP